jgi:hypothetical protein
LTKKLKELKAKNELHKSFPDALYGLMEAEIAIVEWE